MGFDPRLFNLRDLTTIHTIARVMVSDGLRAEDILTDVTREIAARRQAMDRASTRRLVCPECGAQMVRVVSGDPNVRIIGCRACRFSMILEN